MTPEPKGEPRPDEGRMYLIQKHDASRLHYDLRLELGGVLLSWAVPKGPSLDPRDRRLAIHVEDHPVEYGSFEGIIPKGEYGAGAVELWDRGWWEPEGDPQQGLAKGDLKFTIHGEKLKGSWVLAKMKRRSEEEGRENWLLIKHRDEYAVDGDGQAILTERPESVKTGRTIEEIASGLSVGDVPGAKRVDRLPDFVAPEFCTLVKEAPKGAEWVHEIKLDGYRALARLEDGKVRMLSRNEIDWTDRWRSIANEVAGLPAKNAILDGEVVVELENGRTDFKALKHALGTGETDRLLYYVFDLLYLDGYDLTGSPLECRKALLRSLLGAAEKKRQLRYSEDLRSEGPTFFSAACEHQLEGIVSKRADSPYRPGVRGAEWLKTRCLLEQEFVIVGWTPPSRTRIGFGALLLGAHDDDGVLRYVGKVGTGFDDHFLHDFGEKLQAITISKPSVERDLERAPKNANWVEPRYLGEVAFVEWTEADNIRHSTFRGLREDKRPAEVTIEKPMSTAEAEARSPEPAEAKPPKPAETSSNPGASAVTLTHPERVFWPGTGTTKRDLADYYSWVAPYMMPYVLHRPVSMVRCPGGVSETPRVARPREPGPCFFHKHAGLDFPGPFERVEIQESEGPGVYLTITEPDSLIALAQMGVLEIHIWGATWPDIERPDFMVFDLDPSEEVGWPELVTAARLLRDVLLGLGLTSFVKTTGGKGLHVCVPLRPSLDWDGVKRFAKAVADSIAVYAPDKYVSTMSKSKRVGRVFIDYLRNSRTATFIAPYSTRSRKRPTVSVPLRWDELGGRVRPDTYDIGNLRRRLSQLKHDPWEGFFEIDQTITPKMMREIGL
ncbi:MAG: DNA ligase D [Coriobacteriia bacterium]